MDCGSSDLATSRPLKQDYKEHQRLCREIHTMPTQSRAIPIHLSADQYKVKFLLYRNIVFSNNLSTDDKRKQISDLLPISSGEHLYAFLNHVLQAKDTVHPSQIEGIWEHSEQIGTLATGWASKITSYEFTEEFTYTFASRSASGIAVTMPTYSMSHSSDPTMLREFGTCWPLLVKEDIEILLLPIESCSRSLAISKIDGTTLRICNVEYKRSSYSLYDDTSY